MTTGAEYVDNRCIFTVWAPAKERMVLHIVSPGEQKVEMQKNEQGYFSAELEDMPPGTRYFFMPDGKNDFPDPASRYQPEGPHGPSEVVDTAYPWKDAHWRGVSFDSLILYELHIGTFTQQGTFEAAIARLDDLAGIGINAIELMPVCQFPGSRNWGYDGTFPYAVQNTYGGPQGLKKLVDACHQKGIAVFLDVVYNHLGPEGNYLGHYAPYFTNKYRTPWGDAINYDGEWSDGVREYFSENILYWFCEYHIDGLRLDAIHAVFDSGAVHFWELVHQKVTRLRQELGRHFYLIAESDFNNPRVVKNPETGGWGFDAQWLDDFHHALYVQLHKKGRERYIDFGRMEQLAKAYTDGFVHSGEYVKFRKRKHGASSAGIAGNRFVVFNQNHDQVGNRVKGERLCMLVDFERMKLATAAILLSPYIPLLFMGEEYADDVPFFYFVSHTDKDLIKAVQEGRKKEFEKYNKDAEPPDPQGEEAFNQSKLRWEKRNSGRHKIMLQWHKELIQLRKGHPVLRNYNKNNVRAYTMGQDALVLQRQDDKGLKSILCLFNFSEHVIAYQFPPGNWQKLLDSKEARWLEEANSNTALPSHEIISGQSISLLPCSVVIYSSENFSE